MTLVKDISRVIFYGTVTVIIAIACVIAFVIQSFRTD